MKEIFKRQEDGSGGWVINFGYLAEIKADIEDNDGPDGCLSLEDIEQVLCAVERVGLK